MEMDDEEGKAAVEALDGATLSGRSLRINEAREPQQRGRERGW